jgi:hypothetical protein
MQFLAGRICKEDAVIVVCKRSWMTQQRWDVLCKEACDHCRVHTVLDDTTEVG